MATVASHEQDAARQVFQDAVRHTEVKAALSSVRDPEIDETIASLNFIIGTEIDRDAVTLSLRLPTFWCPANFVFMMASEMREAVLALPWVRTVRFQLVDHFAADEISRCISEGLSFADAFPGNTRGSLEDLRQRFDRKAFLMRQGALVSFMRREGFSDSALVQLTLADLDRIASASGGEIAELAADYRKKRAAIGLGMAPQDRVVASDKDEPVESTDLDRHLREIRKATTSARANGEMCRILMAARLSGSASPEMHVTGGKKKREQPDE